MKSQAITIVEKRGRRLKDQLTDCRPLFRAKCTKNDGPHAQVSIRVIARLATPSTRLRAGQLLIGIWGRSISSIERRFDELNRSAANSTANHTATSH